MSNLNWEPSYLVYDKLQLRYDLFCRYIPILEKSVMGCHGQPCIFTYPKPVKLLGFFSHFRVPGNNLATIQNCPWDAR